MTWQDAQGSCSENVFKVYLIVTRNAPFCSLILGMLVAAPMAYAQLTPKEAVSQMGRGINIGNTLEPPTEGAWNNGPLQEYYFDDYRDGGFSTVRIPVRWDQHTSTAAPFGISDSWMKRVEQVVDWGLERDLFVIINGHHEDWLKQDYGNPNLRARYDSIWVQIADRFKDKSDKLLFEIINEPYGMTDEEVDDLNDTLEGITAGTITAYCCYCQKIEVPDLGDVCSECKTVQAARDTEL